MRLGELLIRRGLVSTEDIERALELQRERGDKIGKILVDLGYIAMRDVLSALSEQLEVPLVQLEGPPAVSADTEKLAPRFLRQFRCLPYSLDDHTVTLAMADPLDIETIAVVQQCTGLKVRPVLAAEQEILDALDHRGTSLDSVVFEQYKNQGAERKTYLPMPFAHVVGGEGWGFHLRTSRRAWFDFGAAERGRVWVEVEVDSPSDAVSVLEVAFYEGTPTEVLDGFLGEVGRPRELPSGVFTCGRAPTRGTPRPR